jgi:hypothetical protein
MCKPSQLNFVMISHSTEALQRKDPYHIHAPNPNLRGEKSHLHVTAVIGWSERDMAIPRRPSYEVYLLSFGC